MTSRIFQINTQGDIWGTDPWADPITLYGEYDWSYIEGQSTNKYCSWDKENDAPTCAGHKYETGLIYQAHNAGVEVYPSIGGWTLSDPFSELAASVESRKRFAENCVKLIVTYDFDGIDIDWEYPGYLDHSGRPEDTINYNLFLQEIRTALDVLGEKNNRFYGLTAALPCGPDLIKNIQIDVVSDILTELNLMTYDFHGSWNEKTGANAPLYDMTGSPEFSVHGCVENWKEGGGDPDQINIGLPFYGRSFAGNGITNFGQSFGGKADTATWSEDEGSPQYFNIVNKLAQFTTVRDPQTMTEYMYNSNGFVSYDDERAICDKTEYAMDNDLNGYIIWEISGDILSDLSTPLLDATNDRLNNPSIRCHDSFGGDDISAMENSVTAVDTLETTNQQTNVQVDTTEEASTDTVPCFTLESTEGPWYPNHSLSFCVNDGRQTEHFIQPDQIYPDAVSCCQSNFQYDDECATQSLNPGSTGKWLASFNCGLPWYPLNGHSTVGHCIQDGKHDHHHIIDSDLFTSAEACCDSVYMYAPNCLSESMSTIMEEAQAQATIPIEPVYNVDNTAQQYVPQEIDIYEVGDYMYYPDYGDEGSSIVCRDDGDAPEWISQDMMKRSKFECCESYYFSKSWSSLCNLDSPYYPDFETKSCLNDGLQPSWMAGDYLHDTLWRCCHNSFLDEESLRKCTSVPDCDNCDVNTLMTMWGV